MKNEKKVKDKMIVSGNENNYYGIERTFCVGRINLGELLDLPEGEERWGRREPGELVKDYDFGKPTNNDSKYVKNDTRINRWEFEDAVKDTLDKVMLSGDRNDLVKAVNDKLRLDYTVSVMVNLYSKAGTYINRVNVKLEKVGEELFKDDELTTDLEEITPYMSENEYDTRVNIGQPDHRTNTKTYNGNDAVEYLVKKTLKEKYTYCTKSGKNIVPDNYLSDGEAGIKAYQDEKRGKNKNNSIEKQMIRKIKQQKIQYAFDTFNNTMKIMLEEGTGPHDYTQVLLTVDGRWNTGRRMNTIKKQIVNVPDSELILMTEDEIKTRCKNYWKVTLNRAIKHIDEII